MAETYDRSYRDEAAVEKYPFDPLATQTDFPRGLFLDASLYIPSNFQPPFYIRTVEPAPGDAVRVGIADNRGIIVGTALCDFTEATGTAVIFTDYGRSAGVLVFDPTLMEDLRGDLYDGPRVYTAAKTRLASEIVRFYGPKGVLNVAVDEVSVNNDIRIVFAGGLTYGDGAISLYGEEDSQATQLLTINNRAAEHVLLMAHVYKDYENESALRLETQSSYITIGKSRDFV